ncbi:Arylsulfatase A [Zhouia amylolytica]|uniref:Arylsulfatase A n=2 Tax=Zhouia amylolytica TaxID=376730 RepID=A0A1I6PJA2_9FLAO|nr:Arylsulfatase A [Zhouia amylolytica]
MFKRYVYFMLVLPIFVALLSCNGKTGDQNKRKQLPNIIYINVDDLGWKDTEVFGSTFYETPNINKLAQEGMTFTRGYASAANCAPSRACLMSGQNTPRHGIYTVANSDRGDSRTRKIIPIQNTTVLKDSVITIAEMLKAVGYNTGTFGKWHLGEDPRTQGFNVNIGGGEQGNPGAKGYFAPYNVPSIGQGLNGENLTERLTTEAISFMEEAKETPFFVYLPYYAVHTPLQTLKKLEEKYTEKGGDEFQHNAKYAGMVETVDTNIGRILSFLKEKGLEENTLVIFTSDNGGIRDVSFQDPLRAGKGSYYEGGIRVPYIFKWKNVIAANTKSIEPITNLDIYPTLKEISGSKVSNTILDGISLLPALKGGELPDRELYFHFPIYLQAYKPKTDQGRDPLFRTRPGSVIIDGDWKLHHFFEDDEYELYNLNEDLGEQNNLASKDPEKTEQLSRKLERWRKEVGAPIPVDPNPDYDHEFEAEKIAKLKINLR